MKNWRDALVQGIRRLFVPEPLHTEEDREEAKKFREEHPEVPFSKPARWRSGL